MGHHIFKYFEVDNIFSRSHSTQVSRATRATAPHPPFRQRWPHLNPGDQANITRSGVCGMPYKVAFFTFVFHNVILNDVSLLFVRVFAFLATLV